MSRRVSGVFVTLMTLVLALTVTPLAFGQAYPPGAQAECAREQVPPGASLNCGASGFAPASEVSVEARGNRANNSQGGGNAMGGLAGPGTTILAAAPLAQSPNQWTYSTTVTADENGSVTVSIPIPEDSEGPAEVSFTGFDAEGNVVRIASEDFIVNPALARGQGEGREQAPGLSATGSDFTTGAAIALVVLLLGAAMLVKTRRSGDRVDEDTPAEV